MFLVTDTEKLWRTEFFCLLIELKSVWFIGSACIWIQRIFITLSDLHCCSMKICFQHTHPPTLLFTSVDTPHISREICDMSFSRLQWLPLSVFFLIFFWNSVEVRLTNSLFKYSLNCPQCSQSLFWHPLPPRASFSGSAFKQWLFKSSVICHRRETVRMMERFFTGFNVTDRKFVPAWISASLWHITFKWEQGRGRGGGL